MRATLGRPVVASQVQDLTGKRYFDNALNAVVEIVGQRNPDFEYLWSARVVGQRHTFSFDVADIGTAYREIPKGVGGTKS